MPGPLDGIHTLAFIAAVVTAGLLASAAVCTQPEATDENSPPLSTLEYPTDWRTNVPTFFPTPGPTFPWESGIWGGVADDAQEAAGVARDVLTSPPPLLVTQLDALSYVSVSASVGKEILDPSGETVREVTDDTDVLLFIARGRFSFINRFSETPPPQFAAYCIVVPLGEAGTFTGRCNETIDLNDLGTVRDIPLPLPPFPTPVALAADADSR